MRNVYGTGKTAREVAEALGKLSGVIDDEVMAVVDEVAAEGEKVARDNCPSSRIAFGHKAYPSNGYLIQIEAKGPRVRYPARVDGHETTGPYSFPLVKLLEYGSGLLGDAAYGKEHRWKVNMGNRTEAWSYMGEDGEWHTSEGHVSLGFMRSASEAIREKAPAVCREHLDANKLKKEAGL